MHIEIHDMLDDELVVDASYSPGKYLIEQVTRTEDGCGSTTITITVKNLDWMDEEEDEEGYQTLDDAFAAGYADGVADGMKLERAERSGYVGQNEQAPVAGGSGLFVHATRFPNDAGTGAPSTSTEFGNRRGN